MDLDRMARQPTEDPTAEYDKKKAETSRAFLSSLRGCFFYAYPSYGLVRSNVFLKDVFGGLNHSGELFGPEFWEGSERLQKRSAAFLKYAEARDPKLSLASLVEGNHTRGVSATFLLPNYFKVESFITSPKKFLISNFMYAEVRSAETALPATVRPQN